MVYFLGRKITESEFTLGKQLGVGGFATVYKGKNKIKQNEKQEQKKQRNIKTKFF